MVLDAVSRTGLPAPTRTRSWSPTATARWRAAGTCSWSESVAPQEAVHLVAYGCSAVTFANNRSRSADRHRLVALAPSLKRPRWQISLPRPWFVSRLYRHLPGRIRNWFENQTPSPGAGPGTSLGRDGPGEGVRRPLSGGPSVVMRSQLPQPWTHSIHPTKATSPQTRLLALTRLLVPTALQRCITTSRAEGPPTCRD